MPPMSIVVTPGVDDPVDEDPERHLLPESFDFSLLKKQLNSENIAKKSLLVDPEQLINTVHMLLETVEKQEKNIRSLAKAVAQQKGGVERVQSFTTNTGVMITDPQRESSSAGSFSRPTTPKIVHKETVFVREDDPFIKNQIHHLNNEFAIIQEEYTQHETRLTEVEAIVHEQLTEEKMKTEKKIDEAKEMILVLKFDKEQLEQQMEQLREDMKNRMEENTQYLSSEIKTHFDISKENLDRLQDDYNQKINGLNQDLESKFYELSNRVDYNFQVFKERAESQKNEIEELKYRLTKVEETILKKIEILADKMDKNFRLIEKDTLKTNYIANLLYDVFQLDKNLITDLNDTYVQEKFQLKEDIGKYSKMKKEKNRQEYRKMYTDMLMTTPCFKTIYDTSTNMVHELRWETKLRMDREGDKIQEEFTDIRDHMKNFVSFHEVRSAINENEIVKNIMHTVGSHEKNIETIFKTHLPRAEAWEALKQKADEKNVELKADRKNVNALFDYLNEKLNTILGKTSTEEMMEAIKKLEEKMKSKADKQELIDAQQPIYPPNIINIVRKDIVADDLVVGMGLSQPCLMARGESEQSQSSSYRCLSCHRPTSSKGPPSSSSSSGVSPPKRQNFVTSYDPLPVQSFTGNETARGKLGTTMSDLQQQFHQQLQLQFINPNNNININGSQHDNESPKSSPNRIEKEKPNLVPPSSPSDYFEIPKLNLKKVMISEEMEIPIFKYTIKSSGRSAEEEFEMASSRRDNTDNTDLEKPPSQLNNQRRTPEDMRPKPPRSAPMGGQSNFLRFSVKSNPEQSNITSNSKVSLNTARENERPSTTQSNPQPNSARPNSARDYRLRKQEGPILVANSSSLLQHEEPAKKTRLSKEHKFISDLEGLFNYCQDKFNEKEQKEEDGEDVSEFDKIEIERIKRKIFDIENIYTEKKFQNFTNQFIVDESEIGSLMDKVYSVLNEVKEQFSSVIVGNDEEEETCETVTSSSPPPPPEGEDQSLFHPTHISTEELSDHHIIQESTTSLDTLIVCYICKKSIEKSPVICKYCSKASHYQCCDRDSILRGEDTMICECCTVETDGEPNFYSLIIKPRNEIISSMKHQLKGLSIGKYKIKCPKCDNRVALKDIYSHTGRMFEFDNFSGYPLVPFNTVKNSTEVSRVLIVFNMGKKCIANICERYKQRIGNVEINQMYLKGNFMQKATFITLETDKQSFMLGSLLNSHLFKRDGLEIHVHPVVYFWKSTALQIEIPSKHGIDILPSSLDEFIDCKWENSSNPSVGNIFYIILKDISHCFSILNAVDGLILDNQQIASVRAVRNCGEKNTVLVLNCYGYGGTDELKDFISGECESSFDFDWDTMVEESERLDDYSISIKFQSPIIAKAFVYDFNNALFNEHQLQMFN